MYFSHQRLFCLEMHIGTFWERLRSSDPEQRPHPCLLNAMASTTADQLTIVSGNLLGLPFTDHQGPWT